MSPKNTFTTANVLPILKVLLWSGLSAVVATAIVMLEGADVSGSYIFLVPVLNTVLYAFKEFIADKQAN